MKTPFNPQARSGEYRRNVRGLAAVAVVGVLAVPTAAYANTSETVPPDGEDSSADIVLLDVEDWSGPEWTAEGFHMSPVNHADSGKDVTGYQGQFYLDSWNDSDRRVGHLTSQPMTATADYLNVLIGGGQHPHRPGGTIPVPDTHFFNLEPNPAFATFEASDMGLNIVPLASLGWTGSGDFANAHNSTNFFTGQVGPATLDTCVGRCDAETGTITSATFTITEDWINLLVGGGDHPWGSPGATAVRLLVDGQTVHTASGDNSASLDWTAWDVRPWIGYDAQIQVVDERATNDWGHLMIDNVMFEDRPRNPWSYETGVVVRAAVEDPSAPNGVVLGDVIGSVTGNNSSAMVPATIDLRSVAGQRIVVQVLDTYTGSDWGHLLIDQIVLSDQAAVTP
ncbi:hypothetical protein ACPW96_22610 [Micromonospora sp. DT81.3]|uniref:hypothetical protein n=1 Tax=Micromonospora sp. DT81.3 TaxID=3416523 RepID=UPI003CF08C97